MKFWAKWAGAGWAWSSAHGTSGCIARWRSNWYVMATVCPERANDFYRRRGRLQDLIILISAPSLTWARRMAIPTLSWNFWKDRLLRRESHEVLLLLRN